MDGKAGDGLIFIEQQRLLGCLLSISPSSIGPAIAWQGNSCKPWLPLVASKEMCFAITTIVV